MANPNPENLNVPNEGVPEEDPHHLLDYDEEEDPKMEIEEEEPEEEPVDDDDDDVEEEEVEENEDADMEEDDDAEIIFPYEVQGDQTPSPRDESSAGHGDQFDAHPNPQPRNMNGHVDDHDDEEEDDENEDVDIEEDDDAEIIFPYEVQGDQSLIMPPKPMSEARMREIIRDQFATSMNEFMANMNNRAGGSGGAGSSGGAGRSGGTGGNAGRTGVRDAGPTVPELTGTKAMGIEAPNNTPWSEVRKWMTEEFCHQSVIQRLEQELYNLRMKGMDIDGYTNRFHELALLCPRM
nr:putative reverse transcriptase domain-containing protein [Tanacetum cinerariifolium]